MGRGCLAGLICVALAAPAAASPHLPAPAWLTHGPLGLAAFPGGDASVRAAWSPVDGAARYRVHWSDRASTTDVETRDTHLSRDVRPGDYQLTLVAIDKAGEESVPSAPLAVHVAEVIATPPGAEAPAPPTRDAYAIGTHFQNCHRPGQTANYIARRIGTESLECGPAVVHVVIAPVVIATTAPPLPRGATTVVHVTVASVAELGEAIDVTAVGEITVGRAHRTPLGLDVPVTVAAGARTAALAIAGSGEDLGRVDLAITDAAAAPTASRSAWFALDLGGQVGGMWLPDGAASPRLGTPTAPADVLTSGPLVGAHVGLFPIARAGLELETSVVTTGHGDGLGVATVFANRAQVAVRVFDRDRFGVRVIGGAGALSLTSERASSRPGTAGEVHGGVAATLETRPDLWVRLQIVDVVTTARDAGYSQCPELQLGVMTRFGRRDRW